jgi:hypothetical protein
MGDNVNMTDRSAINSNKKEILILEFGLREGIKASGQLPFEANALDRKLLLPNLYYRRFGI